MPPIGLMTIALRSPFPRTNSIRSESIAYNTKKQQQKKNERKEL